MPIFITIKQPVLNTDGVWKPLYNPLDYNIPKSLFKRHYVQRYYTKGQLHYLWDKVTGKKPQAFRFWVEVTIKNNAHTHDYIELMKSKPEVSIIETPEKYKNF